MTRWRDDPAGSPTTGVSARSQVRFLGGPLDGRVSSLPPAEAVDGAVITHVYLHDGPKIETRYRLGVDSDGGWEYRLLDR